MPDSWLPTQPVNALSGASVKTVPFGGGDGITNGCKSGSESGVDVGVAIGVLVGVGEMGVGGGTKRVGVSSAGDEQAAIREINPIKPTISAGRTRIVFDDRLRESHL